MNKNYADEKLEKKNVSILTILFKFSKTTEWFIFFLL